MGSGFQHDIAGGGGNLIIAQLQSPNFSEADNTGWAILKSGAAFFYDITLPSGMTITITFAATAPVSPAAGDLWYDTSNGLQVSQWNGSAWVAYQIGAGAIEPGSITASLIAANTITAAQLAAGIIYAGIVNSTTINAATFTGSTFEGTDFIINASGAFFYSGTPAAGNLIASVTKGTGTDAEDNAYVEGHATYSGGGSSWFAAALNGGFITSWFATSEAGPWTLTGQINFASNGNINMDYSSMSGVLNVPRPSAPSVITVPHNPNDPAYGGAGGGSWISGERLVLDNQIDDINANFSAIVNALAAAGIWP